jgi:hypothetical protein
MQVGTSSLPALDCVSDESVVLDSSVTTANGTPSAALPAVISVISARDAGTHSAQLVDDGVFSEAIHGN